jgi:hypothetical protein
MAKIIFEFDVKLNKIYLKSVKRCLDCDNRTSFVDYKKPDVCYVSEKREIPNEGIPEWCPLKDFDDKAIDFVVEQIKKIKE